MKKNRIIPECWEEMTQRQFEYLLKQLFVMMSNEDITQDDVINDFADFLCGRNHSVNPWVKQEYLLLVNEAAKLLQWIFTTFPIESDQEPEVMLNFETTQNLLPRIGKLVGPVSHGGDLRFGEYRLACDLYNSYTEENNIHTLDALVGTLYRLPANKQERNAGHVRTPFVKHKIGVYAEQVAHVPEWVKYGVYLWFSYFCRFLMTESFVIDGKEVSFAPVFGRGNDDPDGKQDDSLGMMSVLFSLAESGTFGNIKETDDAMLMDVMLKLLNDYHTAQNLKKQ